MRPHAYRGDKDKRQHQERDHLPLHCCAFRTHSGLAHIHNFPLMAGMLLCVFNFMFVWIKYHPVSHEQLTETVGVWTQWPSQSLMQTDI